MKPKRLDKDQVKKCLGLTTDKALADALEYTPQAVSKWPPGPIPKQAQKVLHLLHPRKVPAPA